MNKNIEIGIEDLSSPEVKRFRVGLPISSEIVEYSDANLARRSKLATKIFGFPWTQKVVVGPDYIDVIKQDWVEWDILANPLAGLIKEHIQALLDENPMLQKLEENPKLEPVKKQPFQSDLSDPLAVKVLEILESQINPSVAGHGGRITLLGVKENKAYIQMEGGCHGCSSSKVTLKQGVEAMIKAALPEIIEVVDATDHSTGENPYFT